jgi:hypothetical protein
MNDEVISECELVKVHSDEQKCEACGKSIQRHGLCYRIAVHDNHMDYNFVMSCVSCKELGEVR